MVGETKGLRNLVNLGGRNMGNTAYDVVVGMQHAGRPADASGS
jgi:hypothetical protein